MFVFVFCLLSRSLFLSFLFIFFFLTSLLSFLSFTLLFQAKLRAGNSCGLTLEEVDLLFRNIARMSNFHVKLLSDLYRRFCTWTDDSDTQLIGEVRFSSPFDIIE